MTVVSLTGANGAAGSSFRAVVKARRLKPVPLLVVEALEDIPLLNQDRSVGEGVAAVVAVTSGKGGTGKTTFSVNLAWHAAARGLRTALLDADIGAGNVAVHFGIYPSAHLGSVLQGEKSLSEIALPITSRLTVYPGLFGAEASADPSPWQFGRLLGAIDEALPAWDLFIVDTGAGVHASVTNLLMTADRTVVVTQDDPAAYLGSYSLIKRLSAQGHLPHPSILVNRVRRPDSRDQGVSRYMESVRLLLNHPVELLGLVPEDPATGESLNSGRPIIASHPRSPAAGVYRQAAERLIDRLLSRPTSIN